MAIMRRRNGPRGTDFQPNALEAEDLAHLFGGLSLWNDGRTGVLSGKGISSPDRLLCSEWGDVAHMS